MITVVKPAEATPLTAVALQRLAVKAGIPPDVFQGECLRIGPSTVFIMSI